MDGIDINELQDDTNTHGGAQPLWATTSAGAWTTRIQSGETRSDHKILDVTRHDKKGFHVQRSKDGRPCVARQRGWRPTTWQKQTHIGERITRAMARARRSQGPRMSRKHTERTWPTVEQTPSDVHKRITQREQATHQPSVGVATHLLGLCAQEAAPPKKLRPNSIHTSVCFGTPRFVRQV